MVLLLLEPAEGSAKLVMFDIEAGRESVCMLNVVEKGECCESGS
jgi:hypothetical protein